jgi:hypothetical protein
MDYYLGMIKNKYNAKKTEFDGVMYDSKKEACRASELNAMLLDGKIMKIERQVPIACTINNIKVCKLICDFVYTLADGTVIHEDVKGMVLPVFKLKQKLVKAIHGIDVQIF